MSKLEIGSCSDVGYGRNRDKTWYPDRFWKYKLEQEGEHLFEIGLLLIGNLKKILSL